MLAWGKTTNGDVLFWQTNGNANIWGIVVNEVRSANFEMFDGPMTRFLTEIVRGSVTSDIISSLLNRRKLFASLL